MKRLICSLFAVIGTYVVCMMFAVMRNIVFVLFSTNITWAIICSLVIGYATFKSMKG